VTVPPGTRERTRTARHGTGRRWRARPTVDSREDPARSIDRKSDAEPLGKDITDLIFVEG
jgi:hypothetical protein